MVGEQNLPFICSQVLCPDVISVSEASSVVDSCNSVHGVSINCKSSSSSVSWTNMSRRSKRSSLISSDEMIGAREVLPHVAVEGDHVEEDVVSHSSKVHDAVSQLILG